MSGFDNLAVATFEDIKKAKENLEGVAIKTLCEYSRSASDYVGVKTYLKYENQQLTGSFKIRGAYNKISNLTKEELSKGVSACSAGNHAQGVAYSARALGAQAHIVMPLGAPLSKMEATRNYGAQVYQSGEVVDEAYLYCMELNKIEGYEFVHPYNDPLVIAGQGTVGIELLEQVKDLDSVVISVGGGGLISGAAMALKSINPKIKVYGAVAAAAPGMFHMFQSKGAEVLEGAKSTIADGIAIRKPSSYIYNNYISKYVDGIVTVTDDEIAQAMVFLLERAKAVVEGAGAAGLAAARKAKNEWELGEKTAVVLCGGNVDLNLISTVIEKGLSMAGRTTRIEVATNDLPGNLNKLTSVLAELDANIIDVTHDRVSSHLALRETLIEFLLETKNKEHIELIKTKFKEMGARVLEPK